MNKTTRPTRHTITIPGDGYRITACYGADACEHRVLDAPSLAEEIHDILKEMDVGNTLRTRLPLEFKAHSLIKISISYCPNGCSRPQIADIGLLGALRPGVMPEACIACGACADVCREDAHTFDDYGRLTALDHARCVDCGDCLDVCGAGALYPSATGFRVQVGGKLGRHPRFGDELPGIYPVDDVPELVRCMIAFHLANARGHERVGDLVNRLGAEAFISGKSCPGFAVQTD